jgi:hypothetical protein
MMEGRLWLGTEDSETLFETGWSSFAENDIEINREERTANGSLAIDTVATKKLFSLAYSAMTQATLDALLIEYDKGTALSFLVERADLTIDAYTVKFRPISRVRLLAQDQWLWRGVTFQLEEV